MEITTTISDNDVLALNNDLLSIDQWVQSAVAGKIAACKKRMLAEWVPRLMADPAVDTLPATEDGLIALIVSMPEYQDRAGRDARGLQ